MVAWKPSKQQLGLDFIQVWWANWKYHPQKLKPTQGPIQPCSATALCRTLKQTKSKKKKHPHLR